VWAILWQPIAGVRPWQSLSWPSTLFNHHSTIPGSYFESVNPYDSNRLC
jgi:hypothetical protein